MEWFETEVAQLERTVRSNRIPRSPAVFYGSSSIRMWGTVSRDLASDRIVNLGFGGSTLSACIYFFDRLVLPVQPASLVLYAGDNDLGDGCSAAQVVALFEQFQLMLDRCSRQIPFGFLGVKPSPSRFEILDRICQANAQIAERLARRAGPSCFIDTVAPMLQPNGRPRAELFLEDGLHLSPAGYRVWTGLLWPYRKQLLIEPTS